MQLGIGIGMGRSAKSRPALPVGLTAGWNLKAATASPIPNLAGGTALTLPAPPNAPAFTSAGLLYDGTDDYATGDQYPLSATGTLIVVARAAATFPSADATYRYRGLLAKTSSGVTAGFAYSIDWNGDNAQRWLRLLIGNGTATNSASAAFNCGGGAHHYIVGRWTGSFVSLWADGTKINEVAQTVNANSALVTPVKVGQVFTNVAAAWNGEIAFAGIYDRALSDAELAQARTALRALLGLTF